MLKPRQLDMFAAALLTGSLGTAPPKSSTPIAAPTPQQIIPATDFRLTGDRALAGKWSLRALDNIEAIELANTLIREGRNATPDEQSKLIRFTGFGASKLAVSLFPPPGRWYPEGSEGWAAMGERLKAAVDVHDYRLLQRATQYAHYTPEWIIREMWRAAISLGFQGGTILEPGCGSGLFWALAPDAIYEASRFVGIERDPITSRIARLLYPNATIRAEDFTAQGIDFGRDGPFDLAIGNPPWSDTIANRGDKHIGPMNLHEFFIWRSLGYLRPDAVAAFAVSRYLMDSGSRSAREQINSLASLIGAVRMPKGSLRAAAGTDVVFDLLFFRRRGEQEPHEHQWLDTAGVQAKGGTMAINRYFRDHPEMVLGEHAVAKDQYGKLAYVCLPFQTGKPLAERLTDAVDAMITVPAGKNYAQIIPENITAQVLPFTPPSNGVEKRDTPPLEKKLDAIAPFRALVEMDRVQTRTVAEGGTIREGSYIIDSQDRLCQVTNGVAVPVEIRGRCTSGGIPFKSVQIIRDLIPIRDAVREILALQEADGDWSAAVAKLRRAYERFVSRPDKDGPGGKRGPINLTKIGTRLVTKHEKIIDEETGEVIGTKKVRVQKTTYARPNLKPMEKDPDIWLIAATEIFDEETNTARPGPIFTQRLVSPPSDPIIKSPADALAVCLDRRGAVDLEYIGTLLDNKAETDTIDALGALIYLDPSDNKWRTADDYLSGPVRTKLERARTMAALDAQFVRNVEALERVQPANLKPSEITARLGAPWIGTKIIVQFAREVLQSDVAISHNADLASWDVIAKAIPRNSAFGTRRRDPVELLRDALNSKTPRIYDETRDFEGRKTRELNAKETELAKEKLSRIKTAFEKWVWTDEKRSDHLVTVYNQQYNNIVPRKFDGSHLTLPEASSAIKLNPHQMNAVWRAISHGSTYLAHVVGSGKTLACVAAIMEQIRLGLIRTAVVTVPAHTLGQWAREWMMFYPGARILVADEANFKDADDRKQFLARAVTGQWDAVVTTHEAFKMIPASAKFEARLIQEIIIDYEEAISRVEENDRISRKRLENLKEKQEKKLLALQARKDDLVTIDQIGDFVVADEAQAFRKLGFATNMVGLLGIDPESSQRSWDLFVKVRFLDSRRPGRAVIMASGTPITNTMGELYTLIRFMALDELESRGQQAFDSFAATHCDTTSSLELGPNGKYKPITRFAKFVNIPEMVAIFRMRADVVNNDDIRHLIKLPALAGGKRTLITAEPSRAFKAYQKTLDARIELIRQRKGRPQKGDDILLKVITDGRHAALDMRLVGYNDNEPDNKINKLIDRAFDIWRTTANLEYTNPATGEPYPRRGAAQMIFSDLGTPSIAEKRGFCAYHWIRDELIRKGVPTSEIAIIHDFPTTPDKLRLFQRINAGYVRFLIGSSEKMGTGVNAQLRLIALHHLDVPWYPMLIGQREGRIIRQGNQNPEVFIYAYATLTSMDAPMWGTNERKQRFIDMALSGDRSIRVLSDDSEVDQFAMAKAIASGDPRIMQQAGLSAEVARLQRLADAHADEQYTIRARLERAVRDIEAATQLIPLIKQDIANRVPHDAPFTLTVQGNEWYDRKEGGLQLVQAIADRLKGEWQGEEQVGSYRGFPIFVEGKTTTFLGEEHYDFSVMLRTAGGRNREVKRDAKTTWHVLLERMDGALAQIDHSLDYHEEGLRVAQETLRTLKPRLGEKFDLQAELDSKATELAEIEKALAEEALNDTARRAA